MRRGAGAAGPVTPRPPDRCTPGGGVVVGPGPRPYSGLMSDAVVPAWYREVMGHNFPAMTCVQVATLTGYPWAW